MGHDLILLIEVGATLGLAILASIPYFLSFTTQLRNRSPKKDVYEDEDGKATPEDTAAFSNKWPKALVLLSAVVGFGTSVATAVLVTLKLWRDGFFLEDWLVSATWALLLFQAVAMAANRSSADVYILGLYTVTCGLALLVVLGRRDLPVFEDLLQANSVMFAFRIVNIVSAVGLTAGSILLPRRPNVYFNGRSVDRMNTTSVYGRLTFGWPTDVIAKAAEKKDLETTDLPRPHRAIRASDVSRAWKTYDFKGPLWRSLLWVYKWSLALQWTMCITASILSFVPQYLTLQLLRSLETRDRGSPIGANVWMLIPLLGLAMIVQSLLESNYFWISWAGLGIPMRVQLSSIIFEKAMRRKNVKAAGKKKKAESENNDAESSGATNGASNETTNGGSNGATNGTSNDAATKADGKDKNDKNESEDDDEDVTGQKSRQAVINLLGVDAMRVANFCMFQFLFPQSAAKLIAAIWFLVYLLGWIPLAAGLATWAIIIPINTYFAKRYSAAQDRLMKSRDAKLAIVNESLQGMRQIKFAALEPQWEKRILDSRNKELKALFEVFSNDIFLFGCWVTSPIALALASLSVYSLMEGTLTPSVAFVSIGIFRSLEVTLAVLPELVTDLLDAWVSVKRIQEYLQGPEIIKIAKNNPEVAFENANIAWPVDEETPEAERFVLRNINVTFPNGELSVISGNTGSGKSLMLSAILGEVDLLAGSIHKPDTPSIEDRHDNKANAENWIIPSSIAYVGQIPWIENATLQDNVLFGLPMDEARYDQTLEACALKKDLEVLTDGDKSELGANGVNLSGGQKWRVTLARALYSRAGILVLDDIFSAVDTHVGRHIFEHGLTGPLCKGRTRILVTHHVALCESKTKYIVELADGIVKHAGLVSELEEDGTLEQIKSHEQTQAEIEEDQTTAVNSEDPSQLDGESEEIADGAPLTKLPSKAPQKFVKDETRETGAVKRRVYGVYIRDSGGWIWWFGVAALFLTYQANSIFRSFWLKVWTGTNEERTSGATEIHKHAYAMTVQNDLTYQLYSPTATSADETPEHSLAFYLGIYVALSTFMAAVGTVRFWYVFLMSIKASRTLFERMTYTVLRTPLRWVDTVPTGRILNRFTADFNIVDSRLAIDATFTFSSLLGLIGICLVSVFVSPLIILFAVVLLLFCARIGYNYLVVARPVKRLESTAKSPIFELFGSALTGLATIRGFDKAKPYVDKMYGRLDDYAMTTWHLWLFARYMGWRMALVGCAFTITVAAFILFQKGIDAALAGFTLSFALDFSSSVLWVIRQYASVELDMNAAERVIEYAELKTEDINGELPPAAWPTEGRLEVNDLVVGYAPDLPDILKGLTFSVNRNERVGVVGRTGAGKSSLTLAIFRFLEARSGSIHVDGLDISKISLHELRSRLAIIPQDPVLFSGTVRSNLDPFENHTDAELRDSLLRVHLVSDSESEPPTPTEAGSSTAPTNPKNVNIFKNLTSAISEGGGNLSQGQRQLLCLARAIVSRPKIMVLDEATSAVDKATDTLIQRSIREEFGDSTLIVIAHRLSTIADFDRILVLSDGQVAEFDTPRALWEKEGGVFRSMCEESGEKAKLRGIIFGENETS